MTREEIINGTLEWLNEQTLNALGIEIVKGDTEEDRIKLGEAILTKKRLAFKNVDGKLGLTDGGEWNPAEDIRDAYELENEIKLKTLHFEYVQKLSEIILTPYQLENRFKFDDSTNELHLWRLIHATPEQRTKAFLLACFN